MNRKIAVIFDFDDTLAPDSTSGFLTSMGIDAQWFWSQRVQRLLDDGWDPIPAYLYEMLEESRNAAPTQRITQTQLRAWGEQVRFYTGVKTIFNTLRRTARDLDATLELEFYLISSGIGEILRASSIARHFTDIWACDFHYNERGEIAFPKNIVSFTEKTRFLFQISKGLVGPASRARHGEVNRKVPSGRFDIPFNRMIVVGDGHTDVPCFSLVKRYGGYAFGVYDPQHPGRWSKAFEFVKEQRVASLYAANYRKQGDLHNALVMAVKDIAADPKPVVARMNGAVMAAAMTTLTGTDSWLETFEPFTITHALVVTVFAALITTLVISRRRRTDTPRSCQRMDAALGVVCLTTWLVANAWWMAPTRFDVAASLPLHICDLAPIIAALALVTSWRWSRSLLYFWGMALSTQGFITPVLRTGPAGAEFWVYWLSHAAIVGAAIYDVAARNYRPGWRDYGFACAASAAYLAFILPIDVALDLNYGYVGRAQPGKGTLVDVLGAWPGRVGILAALAAVAMLIVLLPWVVVRRLRSDQCRSSRSAG